MLIHSILTRVFEEDPASKTKVHGIILFNVRMIVIRCGGCVVVVQDDERISFVVKILR